MHVLRIVGAVLLAIASLPSFAQNGSRMSGLNPQRTGVTGGIGPTFKPSFSAVISPSPGTLQRIADDGSLILIGAGFLNSYTPTGQRRWLEAVPLPPGVRDIALAKDGTVYVSTTGSLHAFNGATGAPVWPTPLNLNSGEFSAPLAIGSDGTIYFHTGGTNVPVKLSAFTPAGWPPKWERSPGGHGYETPVLNTGESAVYMMNTKLLFGAPIGNISTADGAVLVNTPCDPRGAVYAFAAWDRLYTGEINANLLELTPDLQNCNGVNTGAWVTGIVSTIPSGLIITQRYDGTLGAVNRNGTLIWQKNEQLNGRFSDAGGTLYAVATASNEVVTLNAGSGVGRWREKFAAGIQNVLLGGDGCVYVSSGASVFRGCSSVPGPVTPGTFVYPMGAQDILRIGKGFDPPDHLGVDIWAKETGVPVRAISRATVATFEPAVGGFGAWCDADIRKLGDYLPGPALWLRHEMEDGSLVYVLYGHVKPSQKVLDILAGRLARDSPILAGEEVGTVAPFQYCPTQPRLAQSIPHLHFAVWLQDAQPSPPWGYGEQRRFTSPLRFLLEKRPVN
jgi:outer membrane protein assembly factor BamB